MAPLLAVLTVASWVHRLVEMRAVQMAAPLAETMDLWLAVRMAGRMAGYSDIHWAESWARPLAAAWVAQTECLLVDMSDLQLAESLDEYSAACWVVPWVGSMGCQMVAHSARLWVGWSARQRAEMSDRSWAVRMVGSLDLL